jgi:hypothetical protein
MKHVPILKPILIARSLKAVTAHIPSLVLGENMLLDVATDIDTILEHRRTQTIDLSSSLRSFGGYGASAHNVKIGKIRVLRVIAADLISLAEDSVKYATQIAFKSAWFYMRAFDKISFDCQYNGISLSEIESRLGAGLNTELSSG